MLVAQHCHVGVVVEVQQLAPPEQRHGEAVLEYHGRRRAQADGPVPERPERCPAPVEGPIRPAISPPTVSTRATSTRSVPRRWGCGWPSP